MKAAFILGAEYESLTPAELVAELDKRESRAQRSEALKLPQPGRFVDADVWGAANLLLLPNPGGPMDGFVWHVTSVKFTHNGALDAAGLARVDWYIGPPPANVAAADVGEFWEDSTRATTIPAVTTYGKNEKVVLPGEVVYALVSGGAAAEVFTFTGRYIQEPLPLQGKAQWEL